MKKVSIVTINYQNSRVTEALLKSIRSKNTYFNIEIIVVDNGSKDDPIPGWEKKFPEVIFMRSEYNRGFAGGNNMGVKCTTGDYIFFVNNDTEFTEGLVESMVSFMELNPGVGMASPKICYYEKPEILQYAGFTPMNYYTCRNKCIGQFQPDGAYVDELSGPTGYAHGAAMMVRKEVLSKAGLMPEGYFLYYEELDWCEKIKRCGYDIAINTMAVIYHKESMSVGKKTALKEYFMNRNRILFIRRNASPLARLVFYCYFLGIVAPRNISLYVKEKQVGFIKAFFSAIWWNLTNSKHSQKLGYVIN